MQIVDQGAESNVCDATKLQQRRNACTLRRRRAHSSRKQRQRDLHRCEVIARVAKLQHQASMFDCITVMPNVLTIRSGCCKVAFQTRAQSLSIR